MLKICITFDYELFLGKNNASYEEILFGPSEKLSEMLKQNGVSGTFFADVCSAWAHEKFGLDDYCNRFTSQLQKFISDRNDVQLHMHTSWLRSDLNSEYLSAEGYSINEFGFDPNDPESVPSLLKRGKDYLESVCWETDPGYECVAYRAGGFCTQPEENLLAALRDTGFRIDASVVPKMRSHGTTNKYNYTSAPGNKNWWIDRCICSPAERKGNSIFELPVATVRLNPLKLLSVRNVRLPYHAPKGEYVNIPASVNNQKNSIYSKIISRLTEYRTLSFDSQHSDFLQEELYEIFRREKCDKNNIYLALICHPKLAENDRIENMERLISNIANQNRYNIKFVSVKNVYDDLIKNQKESSEGLILRSAERKGILSD